MKVLNKIKNENNSFDTGVYFHFQGKKAGTVKSRTTMINLLKCAVDFITLTIKLAG